MSKQKPTLRPSKASSSSPSWIDPRHPPELYLFLSVDIEGSTKFKNSADGPTTWGPFFLDFFDSFPGTLKLKEASANVANAEARTEKNENFKLWKSLGDELLFFKKLNCGLDAFSGVLAASLAIQSGAKKLQQFRDDREKAGDKVQHYPTQLKGTAWVAGFPIKNLIVKRNELNEPIEFIGPSIDLGFRLAKFASPSRMILSAPLAWILATTIKNDGKLGNLDGRKLQFSYLGRESLKGVDNVGIGYPIFWINLSESVHGLSDEERTVLGNYVQVKDIINFCESLFNDPDIHINRPFIRDDHQYKLGIPDIKTEEGKKYKRAYNDFLTAFPAVSADVSTTTKASSNASQVISEIKIAVEKVGSRAAARKVTVRKPAAKSFAAKKPAVKKAVAKKPTTNKPAVKKTIAKTRP